MKKVLHLFTSILVITGIFFSLVAPVAAWNPASMQGNMYFRLPDGTLVPIQGARVIRFDHDDWGESVCGNGENSCYDYNKGVETNSNASGYWKIADEGNIPGPVCLDTKAAGGALYRCPAGGMNSVPYAQSARGAIPTCTDAQRAATAYCGIQCQQNRELFQPYFPRNYTIPATLAAQGYSLDGGKWSPDKIEIALNNNTHKSGQNFYYELQPPKTPPVTPPPTDGGGGNNGGQPGTPSGTFSGSCANQPTATSPLAFNLNISNINMNNQAFDHSDYYLIFTYNSTTAEIRNFLGRSTWEPNGGLKNGDQFGYILGSNYSLSGNSLGLTWNNNVKIGGTIGAGKTLGQLAAWAETKTPNFQYTVGAALHGAELSNVQIAGSFSTKLAPDICFTGEGDTPVTPPPTDSPVTPPPSGGPTTPPPVTPPITPIPPGCVPGNIPDLVSNLQPSGKTDMTYADGKITVQWDQPTSGTVSRYEIKIYDRTLPYSDDPDQQACGNNRVHCGSAPSSANSYDWAVTPEVGEDIAIAVRAVYDACGPGGTDWAITTANLVATLSGNFYLDDGSCTGSAGGPVSPGGSVTVNSNGTTFSVDVSGNSFSIADVPFSPDAGWYSNIFAQYTPADSLTTCACGASDCKQGNLTSPDEDIDFYLESLVLSNGPWWQTRGGFVYVNSGNLYSAVPASCASDLTSPLCVPYIIGRTLDNANASAGIPMTGGGSVSTKIGGNFTDRNEPNTRVEGTTQMNPKEDYQFFATKITLSEQNLISGSTISAIPSGSKTLSDGTKVFYTNNSLTIDPSSTITFGSGKTVFFINGDLRITNSANLSRLWTLSSSGFVSFIVSGNIIFEPSVGGDDPNQTLNESTVTGLFIADGQLIVQGFNANNLQDKKFIGNGSYIGWSGVQMLRDYANSSDPLSAALNNDNPTESFVFNPNLVLNAPEFMKDSSYEWREVN